MQNIKKPAPHIWRNLVISAERAAFANRRVGVEHYDRASILPRLLPRLRGEDSQDTAKMIAALEDALRHERARSGHWTYQLGRHIALAQALAAERARRK